MRKKYLILFSTFGAILAFDQFTKHIIQTSLKFGESVPVIDGFFNFVYVRNPGGIFGLFSSIPSWAKFPFFLIPPILALGILIYIFRKLEDKERILTFSLACISGGAIGNFIDRIRFFFVIDFIDIHIGQHHWPAFNIADVFITIGALLFALHILFFEKKRNDTSQSPE